MTDTPKAPIVTALLRDGNRILLVHRSPRKRWYPDLWDMPGGHVEPGERPTAALVREIHEERPGRHPPAADGPPAGAIGHPASMIGDTSVVEDDLDRIEAAFAGTPLAGLPIGHGPSGTVLVTDIDPGSLHEAWQAADALVPVLGRLPFLVTDDFDDTIRIQPEPAPSPPEPELRAFAEAAATSEPWAAYRDHNEDDQVGEGEIEFYTHGTGGIDLTNLVSDVPLPAPVPALERALYDRLLTDADLHARVHDRVRVIAQTEYWYTPDSVMLLLTPTTDVRTSAYWVDFYGALTREYQQKLAEILAQWRDRWDARLVAAWGTMLQFQVGCRPSPGDDAWTAAGQLKALAPNLPLSRWEVAVALSSGDAWFVHNRP
ncbi:NUDIX domain-containing protein [Actinoplanes hulinensis]|uniref:NUDIX domain-containing protein n=1 Tax=Actinoplanes hulinensis TaxID=1144547 RepID=UPI0027E2F6F9|nr:NUDIX domain-containing protein [Actinoplanes hulinensis]